jgi:hypothetical protein
MTDHDLSDLLDRLGERAPVGSPPTEAMLAAAVHSRRRRTTWLAAGSTAAVLALTTGGVVVLTSEPEPVLPQPAPGIPTPTQQVAPPGTRFVGLGHASIAVPEGWGTNELRCGTPQQDTVIIDEGSVCLAYFPRPTGVESVFVYPGWYRGFANTPNEVQTESFDLDGEPAERVVTDCPTDINGYTLCRGAVYLPGQDVTFVAESSSEKAQSEVAEILSWIRILPGLVAVPGFQDANEWDHAEISRADHYREALETLGLRVEVASKDDRIRDEGYVLGVEPPPGTMLAPGSVVRVTEVASRD